MDVSRSRLVEIIQEWNATRLEMFALSLPDQNLEFYGVMRFYYYEAEGNIATKCLRVYSTATVSDVVFALLDKLSSIKIISTHTSYGMCEVHSDGTTRVLDMDELPLLLQLTWMKDCIEGRFLLRQSDNFVPPNYLAKNGLKTFDNLPTDDSLLAKDLYRKIPDNLFTQSISNPEVVMRRKRHQKLDRKLVQISGVDGAPDKGAPMRIYGTLLNPGVPYKTLLLSYKDNADFVVKEMLGKYMMGEEDPDEFVLVELTLPPGVTEYSCDDILEGTPLSPGDIPYLIRSKHDSARGLVLFHVVRKEMFGAQAEGVCPIMQPVECDPNLPYLKQVGRKEGEVVFIRNGVTLFGRHPPQADVAFVEMTGEDILGAHARVSYDGKVVMVHPLDKAKVFVNHVPVFDNFVLLHGDLLQLGSTIPYKMYVPGFVEYSTEFVDRRNRSTPTTLVNSYPLIPAQVEFPLQSLPVLLRSALEVSPSSTSFKLGPSFFVYLLARHFARAQDTDGVHSFLVNAAASLSEVMKASLSSPALLAFWISNCVELLQLLIKDAFVALSSPDVLSIFLEACTVGYDELFEIISRDLESAASCFFRDVDEVKGNILERVFDVVGSSLYTLQTNKMHPAITLMFFTEMFDLLSHHIVQTVLSSPKYCSSKWGRRLKERLSLLARFAALQGLEQSAALSLQLSFEIADFLSDVEDKINVGDFKHLNSLQVEHILGNLTYSHQSRALSNKQKQDLVHQFIRDVDSLLLHSNGSLLLVRDVEKQPFSLPDSGYHYESLEEVPNEFIDYVAPIFGGDDTIRLELNGKQVTVIPLEETREESRYPPEISRQLASMGLPQEPRAMTLKISKLNGTLGISLAAARSQTDGSLIIVVDSIVKEGAAHLNGKIHPFDQLLMVDSNTLINVSLARVTQIMINSSDVVELRVIQSGALYHLPYRLLKNVSPKFHSLLETDYSRPPSIVPSFTQPEPHLEPIILNPIKGNAPLRNSDRNRPQHDQTLPKDLRTENPTQPKGDSNQHKLRQFIKPLNKSTFSRPSNCSDSFLKKLNSIPPRSDSRFANLRERSRQDFPSSDDFVLRPPARTPPPSRKTISDGDSSPHMARVVSTLPTYSNMRHMCEIPEPIHDPDARRGFPESVMKETKSSHNNQIPPERVSSLNFRGETRGYRPIIKIFEEDDSERTPKSVSFVPQRQPGTYSNVYNSALRNRGQLYSVD